MFAQLMVGILLVEFAGPLFVGTAERAKTVISFALSGVAACGIYLLISVVALSGNNN